MSVSVKVFFMHSIFVVNSVRMVWHFEEMYICYAVD